MGGWDSVISTKYFPFLGWLLVAAGFALTVNVTLAKSGKSSKSRNPHLARGPVGQGPEQLEQSEHLKKTNDFSGLTRKPKYD